MNLGDYHLIAGSPAIDSANADAPNQPTTDIEGNPRVDDPDTADSGAGTRSYDDRGALEFQPLVINQSPVITEGASVDVIMSENGAPTAFNLTLHATDADAGDTLTWSVSSAASQGTASASGTGASQVIGYTPNADYSGSDAFDVQVSDGNGGTATITVNVTIEAVNNAPLITEGISTSVTMSEDGAPTAFNLTLNATDADVTDTLTWSVSSAASQGTATASGTGASQVIGYTPNADYNGSDAFDVQVSDGNGGTATITVNVTIEAVNDAPLITEGISTSVTMSEDGAPTAFNLTLNATDADADRHAHLERLLSRPRKAQPLRRGPAPRR